MSQFNRNYFSNIPVEYVIPKPTEVVFVSDFYASDMQGGAELTTDAILKSCHYKLFKLHSSSVTRKLIEANKDKYWVFGNFAMLNPDLTSVFVASGIRYSVIEYDFKFCQYRSTARHQKETGHPCTCPQNVHGLDIAAFFQKAEKIFWMSERQKEHWVANVPALASHPGHFVLSSVFDQETLALLADIRKNRTPTSDKWAVLGSGSWIKGVEQTVKWCKENGKPFEALPAMPYGPFLNKMSTYKGFIFMPLDYDTCPRVTIEAKLMGLELILDENVLHQVEPWFQGSVEECEEYMASRAMAFWCELPVKKA